MGALSFLEAFLGGEQFDEQGAEPGLAQKPGEFGVASVAAAAGVRKNDETFGVGGHHELAIQHGGAGGDANVAGDVTRRQPVSFSAHNLPFHP